MMEEASGCSQPKADRRSGYDCSAGECDSSSDLLARWSMLKLRSFFQSSGRYDREGEPWSNSLTVICSLIVDSIVPRYSGADERSSQPVNACRTGSIP